MLNRNSNKIFAYTHFNEVRISLYFSIEQVLRKFRLDCFIRENIEKSGPDY